MNRLPDVIEAVRVADPAADLPPAGAATRDALLSRIVASPVRPPRARRRAVRVLAGAAAAAAVLAVFGSGLLSNPDGSAEAQARAALLRTAAVDGAGSLVPTRPLRTGDYLYTRTVSEAFTTMDDDDGNAIFASVPQTREQWRDRNGAGWEIWRSGAPRFATDRDRSRWIAAGRPELGIDGGNPIKESDDLPPMYAFPVPGDPDALYARITDGGHADPDAAFQRLNELLAIAGYLTPAQRAAFYEVALRLPGVELRRGVKDAAGRLGTGVAMDLTASNYRQRTMLIFDPRTGALLAEKLSTLDGNAMGYPAGTPTGMTTYARAEVVDDVRERP